jgi:ABC-type transport system involved in multi-copper enzyme maturation permease subunit
VIVTALRDRLFASLLGLLAITFGISAYLGGGAIAEAKEMTIVYAAGSARVILVLGIIVFVAFHVERLYDTREIEALLSRAISREKFVVAYWMGLAVIAVLLTAPVIALIGIFGISGVGAAIWSVSVFFETLIVLAFALFCALTLERSIPTIFATVGFYALARLISFFTGIADHGTQLGMNKLANPMVDALSYMIPRLDLAGQTRWLVYGSESHFVTGMIVLQAVIYVPLLLLAAMFDLRRKSF